MGGGSRSALPSQLVQCPLLNVSVCAATDRQLPTGDGGAAVLLLAYNPLAWRRRDVVRVPVRSTVQVPPESERERVVDKGTGGNQ